MKTLTKATGWIAAVAAFATQAFAQPTKVPGTLWMHEAIVHEWEGTTSFFIGQINEDNEGFLIFCENNKLKAVSVSFPYSFFGDSRVETKLDGELVNWPWKVHNTSVFILTSLLDRIAQLEQASEFSIRVKDRHETRIASFDLEGIEGAIAMLDDNCNELIDWSDRQETYEAVTSRIEADERKEENYAACRAVVSLFDAMIEGLRKPYDRSSRNYWMNRYDAANESLKRQIEQYPENAEALNFCLDELESAATRRKESK